MKSLNRDTFFLIAKDMDIRSLVNFCQTDKQAAHFCQNDTLWRYRLNKDFQNENWKEFGLPVQSCKDLIKLYTLLYQLRIVKQKLNIKRKTLLELYNSKQLNLYSNKIKEIPKEIAQLQKLQMLNLDNNLIKEIPKELGDMQNLRVLYLQRNQIREIPKELENMRNLRKLYLTNNPIKEIPKEISNLNNLELDLDF